MTGFRVRPDRCISAPGSRAAALLCVAAAAAPIALTPHPAPAGEVGREGEHENLRLIVDYLPNILYVGDDMAICLRAENASGRKLSVAVSLEFQDDRGKERRSYSGEGECDPGRFWQYRRSCGIGHSRSFSYALRAEGGDVERHAVRIVRPEDAFPSRVRSYSFDAEGMPAGGAPDLRDRLAHARAGGLWDEVSGERLLFLVTPRLRKEDRRWAPLRWLFGGAETSHPQAKPVIFAPRMRSAGPAGGASLAAILKSKAARTEIVELPPPSPLGAEPVLEAACLICAWMENRRKDARPDRLVILLPCEDVEWATGPREYKLALELLLSRMETMGAPRVVLAPPTTASVPRRRLEIYRTQVRETASIYGQSFADMDTLLADECWRTADGKEAVLGEKMNSKGIERLADELLKWTR